MNDELRELAALRALGALEPADAARLDEALRRDPDLAAQLAADEALLAALGRELPRVAAPDGDAFARTLAAARAAAAPAPAAAAPVRRSRRRLRPQLLGGLAAVAAAAVALGVYDAGRGDTTPDARATLARGQARGTAELFHPDRAGGTLRLRLSGVAPAPAGHHYEVWVLRAGQKAMASVARVTPESGTIDLRAKLPTAGTFVAIDVSLETDGAAAGPGGPNGPSVVLAEFRPA